MITERPVEAAYWQGVAASRVTGPESQMIYNPYTDDSDDDLYDAWEKGASDASEPGFVFDLAAMQRAAKLPRTIVP